MVMAPHSRPYPHLVQSGSSTVVDNQRVLRDFTRVCLQVGILDPDDGLIRFTQRDRSPSTD